MSALTLTCELLVGRACVGHTVGRVAWISHHGWTLVVGFLGHDEQ